MAIEGAPGGQWHQRMMSLGADAAPKGNDPTQVNGLEGALGGQCHPGRASPPAGAWQ